MKKFLPVLIFVMCFTGFLSSVLVKDLFYINAEQLTTKDSQVSLYEKLYSEMTLTSSKGTVYKLADIKTPLVVINFWASWCAPCLREFPSLVKFHGKFKDKITVVGMNGDETDTNEMIAKISKKYQLGFESVPDGDSKISDKFMVSNYPFTIIYHKGKVVHISEKTQDFMDSVLVEKIESLL